MPDSPYLGNDSAAITAEALTPGGVPASPDTSNLPASSGGGPQGNPTVTPPTDNSYGNLQASPPPQQGKGKGSFMSDILHAIGEVLGGPSSVKRVNPETGALEDHPLNRAERIANTAGIYLRGAAAGAAQHGPGAVGKAALAGATEQQQFGQQQQENTLEQSKNVQSQLAGQASRALQAQQIAESGWRMQREGTEMDIATADRFNAMNELVASNPKNQDLGHYESFADLLKAHPELTKAGVSIPQLMGQGRLRAIVTTEGGKSTGIQVYKVDPDWEKQKTDKPVTLKDANGLDAKGNVQYQTQEIPAGSISNGELLTLTSAKNQKSMDAQEKAADIKRQGELAKSEESKNYAEAKRAVAETGIKGADEMIDKGRNPFTGEQLTINNSPDTQPVDAEGHPIPFKSLSYMKPAPTEVQRATFAKSVLHILDSIDDLKKNGKLPNGPLEGRSKQALASLGLGDKDSQEALNYISLAQTAATGAHVGGRFSTQVMDKLGQLIKINMNDSQFSGAEEAIRDVMDGYIKSGGRMTAGEWKNDHAVYVNNQLVGYASDDGRGMIPVAQAPAK